MENMRDIKTKSDKRADVVRALLECFAQSMEYEKLFAGPVTCGAMVTANGTATSMSSLDDWVIEEVFNRR